MPNTLTHVRALIRGPLVTLAPMPLMLWLELCGACAQVGERKANADHRPNQDSREVARQTDQEPNITADMIQADARLLEKITIRKPRIHIGELADDISKQTRVRILTGEKDGSADPNIALFCQNTPLYKLLNGLWSLMSYRGAAWKWERAKSCSRRRKAAGFSACRRAAARRPSSSRAIARTVRPA